jgi:hypothetical protein
MEIEDLSPSPGEGQQNGGQADGANQMPNSPNIADANPTPTEPSSSSGNDAKSAPKSMADVVSATLAGKEGSSTSGQPPVDQKSKDGIADPNAAQQPKGQELGKKDGEGPDEIPQEFHKHPAWQKLKKQRDEYRTQVDQFRSDSQEYQVITGFMQEHSIEPTEVAETLQWLALKNSDPVKFGQMIVDLAAQFQEEMGLVLPKELQARVEAGEITEEDANELARSKAEANLYKTRTQQQTQQQNSQREIQARQQLGQTMANTVNNWEKQIQVRDPDYQAKRRLVQSEIRAYIQQYGMPKDAVNALKYAETAYKAVSEHLAGVLPKRKPNDPIPQGGKQVETNFVPKSLADVVSHALSGGG